MQDDVSFRYTEAEAVLIGRLAQVRARADQGNRAAKQQIAKAARQLVAYKKAAKRGNARAARAARVLEESGLFVSSQIFAMDGASPWEWKLGGLNVLNATLLATTAVLAWRKRWGYAALPLGAFLIRDSRQKGWW